MNVTIDCDACAARGPACGDCVVTLLLDTPPEGIELDETERRAIAALAAAGLIPPLRLALVEDAPRRRRPHVA